MTSFKAFRVDARDGTTAVEWVQMTEADLDHGEVTVRVAYSCVNYKDALAVTGAGRIIRRFPCVAGIDLAGNVLESTDARFRPGDAVLATSFDLGVAHHGGYAERARLPAAWVRPLPAGLTLLEAMALGTAGLTAALAVLRMEENGLRPEQGPVIVTGATGGVGSIAIEILAGQGYAVSALTGKDGEADYLRTLGAAEVLSRSSLPLTDRSPLGPTRWAGAVDNLGGAVLSWLCRTMQRGGSIASIGLVAGAEFQTTVMPFILRGVSLLGIDSGYIGDPHRSTAWARLAGAWKPRHLAAMIRVIDFDDLPAVFPAILAGQMRGRVVVRISGE